MVSSSGSKLSCLDPDMDKIILPPSHLRRDVDKKSSRSRSSHRRSRSSSSGSRRLKHRDATSRSMSQHHPLGMTYTYEDEQIATNVGCKQPELFLWKHDLDKFFGTYQTTKNTKTYVEWKKAASKKRKKKKRHSTSSEGHALRDSVSQDDSVSVDIPTSPASSKGEFGDKYDVSNAVAEGSENHSRKENAPPPSPQHPQQQLFKPTFSRSRYSNLQKFRTLAAYYRQKEKIIEQVVTENSDRDPESVDDLASIKQELADLKRWATTKNDKTKRKKVQFAHPLISQLKYRPKTRPEEIDELYFREEELLDWEEDRETTSPEFVELVITEDDGEAPVVPVCDNEDEI